MRRSDGKSKGVRRSRRSLSSAAIGGHFRLQLQFFEKKRKKWRTPKGERAPSSSVLFCFCDCFCCLVFFLCFVIVCACLCVCMCLPPCCASLLTHCGVPIQFCFALLVPSRLEPRRPQVCPVFRLWLWFRFFVCLFVLNICNRVPCDMFRSRSWN